MATYRHDQIGCDPASKRAGLSGLWSMGCDQTSPGGLACGEPSLRD
ncbi:hypothetical protein P3T73_16760 [Kiritimatiellota bacterium B12222]|nr:hypothetical protein P3T73_16760 [Kiritimatiellota bacterium B12222]